MEWLFIECERSEANTKFLKIQFCVLRRSSVERGIYLGSLPVCMCFVYRGLLNLRRTFFIIISIISFSICEIKKTLFLFFRFLIFISPTLFSPHKFHLQMMRNFHQHKFFLIFFIKLMLKHIFSIHKILSRGEGTCNGQTSRT